MNYDDVIVLKNLDFRSIIRRFLGLQANSGPETQISVTRMKRAFEQGIFRKFRKNCVFCDFGPKSADLWLFRQFFGIFQYLGKHFLGFDGIFLRVFGSRKPMPLSVLLHLFSFKKSKKYIHKIKRDLRRHLTRKISKGDFHTKKWLQNSRLP